MFFCKRAENNTTNEGVVHVCTADEHMQGCAQSMQWAHEERGARRARRASRCRSSTHTRSDRMTSEFDTRRRHCCQNSNHMRQPLRPRVRSSSSQVESIS